MHTGIAMTTLMLMGDLSALVIFYCVWGVSVTRDIQINRGKMSIDYTQRGRETERERRGDRERITTNNNLERKRDNSSVAQTLDGFSFHVFSACCRKSPFLGLALRKVVNSAYPIININNLRK